TLDDVTLLDGPDDGLAVHGALDLVARGLVVRGCAGHGVSVLGSSDVTLTGLLENNGGCGVRVASGARKVTLTDGQAADNRADGVEVRGSAEVRLLRTALEGNHANGASAAGVGARLVCESV